MPTNPEVVRRAYVVHLTGFREMADARAAAGLDG
jgi:hypothetical protein